MSVRRHAPKKFRKEELRQPKLGKARKAKMMNIPKIPLLPRQPTRWLRKRERKENRASPKERAGTSEDKSGILFFAMSETLLKLPIGDKAPDIVNAVIAIPQGSQNKYEFDEKLGVFKLDRVGYSALRYPTDYGFIPETRSEDGDHLDVMVLGNDPLFP